MKEPKPGKKRGNAGKEGLERIQKIVPDVASIVQAIRSDVSVAPQAPQAPRGVSDEGWKAVLHGAAIGMHHSRLWGLSGLSKRDWDLILEDQPWRREEIERASVQGERDLADEVRLGERGWESKAWILERSREGWRRAPAQGAPLAVAVQVLGRFDDCEAIPNAQTVEPKRLSE